MAHILDDSGGTRFSLRGSLEEFYANTRRVQSSGRSSSSPPPSAEPAEVEPPKRHEYRYETHDYYAGAGSSSEEDEEPWQRTRRPLRKRAEVLARRVIQASGYEADRSE